MSWWRCAPPVRRLRGRQGPSNSLIRHAGTVVRGRRFGPTNMQQRVVPLSAPALRRGHRAPVGCYETKARGMAVLTTPLLNKGTAFTPEERDALGLTGLLPPVISTLEAQVTCAYAQYQRLQDALSRNIYLTALH